MRRRGMTWAAFLAMLMAVPFLGGCKVVDGALETSEALIGAASTTAVSVIRAVATPEEEAALAAGGPEAQEAAQAVAGRVGLDPTDPKVIALLLALYGAGAGTPAVVRKVRKQKGDEKAA